MHEVLVSYQQLSELHGITFTRSGLYYQIAAGTFPPPLQLSPQRIAWRLSEIELWKNTRPTAKGAPIPVLWPVRGAAVVKLAGRGRRQGGRIQVIDGRRRVVYPDAAD
jgi:prophage regulatory protein